MVIFVPISTWRPRRPRVGRSQHAWATRSNSVAWAKGPQPFRSNAPAGPAQSRPRVPPPAPAHDAHSPATLLLLQNVLFSFKKHHNNSSQTFTAPRAGGGSFWELDGNIALKPGADPMCTGCFTGTTCLSGSAEAPQQLAFEPRPPRPAPARSRAAHSRPLESGARTRGALSSRPCAGGHGDRPRSSPGSQLP